MSILVYPGVVQQGSNLNQEVFDAIAPTNLIVTANTGATLGFSWTINSTNAEGSRIYKSTDGVNYTEDGTVSGATNTYTASGLTAGNLYYFKVVSYSGSTESDPTNIYDTFFKITVDTTQAGSASDTFVLPTTGAGYSATVYWGDGTSSSLSGTPGNVTKQYAASGTYQISITGTFPRYYQNNAGDKLKVLSIDNWGNVSWSSMSIAFRGCENLSFIYIDVPNLENVTVLERMFQMTGNPNSPVITNWDFSNITNMSYFIRYTGFNGSDISDMDTSLVTTFTGAFAYNTSIKSKFTFSIQSATSLDIICEGNNINTTGTTTNYDDTLISWASQAETYNKSSLTTNFGTSKYSSAAQSARDYLVNTKGWTITDGGLQS